MKFRNLGLGVVLAVSIGSAHADSPGTYRCDIELTNGSKTVVRLQANSDSHAARLVKESRDDVKYINCFKISR